MVPNFRLISPQNPSPWLLNFSQVAIYRIITFLYQKLSDPKYWYGPSHNDSKVVPLWRGCESNSREKILTGLLLIAASMMEWTFCQMNRFSHQFASRNQQDGEGKLKNKSKIKVCVQTKTRFINSHSNLKWMKDLWRHCRSINIFVHNTLYQQNWDY